MRSYETMFIAVPGLSSEALDHLIETFEEVIKGAGGESLETDKSWGLRKLAYEIRDFREGYYTIFRFEGDGDVVKELERRFRLSDSVLRYLTVRDERKKRLTAKGDQKKSAKEAKKKSRAPRYDAADSDHTEA
jgi:small subunit ribosomal protein S6